MICPKCNGNKEIHTPIYTQGNPFMPSGWEYRTCEYCNGTGEVEQTNEEWLRSLGTAEEMAKGICECVKANSWSFNESGVLRWLQKKRK